MPVAPKWPLLSLTSLPIHARRGQSQQAPNPAYVSIPRFWKEVGIDLSEAKPQKLTDELAREAQLLITMGCGDKCPYVPGLRRDDWPLQDPKGLPMEELRMVRNEIKSRAQTLLASEGVQGFERMNQ